MEGTLKLLVRLKLGGQENYQGKAFLNAKPKEEVGRKKERRKKDR